MSTLTWYCSRISQNLEASAICIKKTRCCSFFPDIIEWLTHALVLFWDAAAAVRYWAALDVGNFTFNDSFIQISSDFHSWCGNIMRWNLFVWIPYSVLSRDHSVSCIVLCISPTGLSNGRKKNPPNIKCLLLLLFDFFFNIVVVQIPFYWQILLNWLFTELKNEQTQISQGTLYVFIVLSLPWPSKKPNNSLYRAICHCNH